MRLTVQYSAFQLCSVCVCGTISLPGAGWWRSEVSAAIPKEYMHVAVPFDQCGAPPSFRSIEGIVTKRERDAELFRHKRMTRYSDREPRQTDEQNPHSDRTLVLIMAEEKNSLPSVLILGGSGFIGRNLVCFMRLVLHRTVPDNLFTSRKARESHRNTGNIFDCIIFKAAFKKAVFLTLLTCPPFATNRPVMSTPRLKSSI